MWVIALRLRQTCEACDAPVSIARLFHPTRCSRCDAVVEFDRSLVEGVRWGHHDVEAIALGEGGKSHREARTQDATCAKCGAFLPEVEGPVREVVCTCGVRTPMRALSGELGDVATHVLGEAPEGAEAPLVAPEAITVHCSSCGGPIDARGESRSVRCAHCGVDVVVPDNLWERAHPLRVAPWLYLWRAQPIVGAKKRSALGTGGTIALLGLLGSLLLALTGAVQWLVDAYGSRDPGALRFDQRMLVAGVASTIVFGVGLWRALRAIL